MKWSQITKKKLKQVTKMKEEGRTNKEIAHYLNIDISTFYEWKKVKPDFSDCLIIGEKKISEKVKNRLIDMCLGFEHTEQKFVTKVLTTKDGERIGNKEITKTVIVKKCLPSIPAIIFYLKNKMPDEFVDIELLKGVEVDEKDTNVGTLDENITKYLEEADKMDQ